MTTQLKPSGACALLLALLVLPLAGAGGQTLAASFDTQVSGSPGTAASQAQASRSQTRAARPSAASSSAQDAASSADASDASAPANAGVPNYPKTLEPATAVAMALARRPEIEGAQALIARREADLKIVQSAWWPTLQYGLNPGYGGSGSASANGEGGGKVASLRGNIGVEQLLYDFGATSARERAAQAQRQAAQANQSQTAEKVASDTLAAYVRAAVAQEQMATARGEIEAMRGILGRISMRARAGLSSQSDVSVAQASMRRAEIEVRRARTEYEAAMSTLISYVGVWPARLQPLTQMAQTFAGADDAAPPDFEAAPSVQMAVNAKDAAIASEAAARADRYPSIGVGLNRGQSSSPRDSSYNSTWVGVTLRGSFNLGGGGRERVSAAVADRIAAEKDLDAKRLQTRADYSVAQRKAAGASARLTSLNSLVSLSMQNKNFYWQEYMLDKRSLSDVLNTERDIYAAQSDRILAQGDTVDANVAKWVAVGKLIGMLEGLPMDAAAGKGRGGKAGAAVSAASTSTPVASASVSSASSVSASTVFAAPTASVAPAPIASVDWASPAASTASTVSTASSEAQSPSPSPIEARQALAATLKPTALSAPNQPDSPWSDASQSNASQSSASQSTREALSAPPDILHRPDTSDTALSAQADSSDFMPAPLVARPLSDRPTPAAPLIALAPSAAPPAPETRLDASQSSQLNASQSSQPSQSNTSQTATSPRQARDDGAQTLAVDLQPPAAAAVALAPAAPSSAAWTSSTATALNEQGWHIQLGAFAQEGRAQALWQQIQSHPALVSQHPSYPQTSTRLTRLVVGPYDSRAQAASACQRLVSHKQPCAILAAGSI